MEMLEAIESFQQEQASVQRLFGGEGRKVRNVSNDPQMVMEALKIIQDVTSGRKPVSLMREAMSTSDFPLLFADILDRQLLGSYTELPAVWQNYIRRGRVSSFRSAKRFAVDGAEGALAEVDEREEYPEEPLSETFDTVHVRKYGKRLDLSWEALINDDLDAFGNMPGRLARAARRTEQRLATQMYVDANGPHADLYRSTWDANAPLTKGNIVPGNPPLTIEGLQRAFTMLSQMTDVSGEPIMIDAVELVVGPGLQVTAENIMNATQLFLGDRTDPYRASLETNNWMRGKVRLTVDPYLPMIAKTVGATSWFLFANPTGGRSAAELTFLAGEEVPALYERLGNARRVGGTGEAVESFEDDSRAWRVRHVLGGARFTNTGGWRVTVASNGTGPRAS
jgi:hypothetical protein